MFLITDLICRILSYRQKPLSISEMLLSSIEPIDQQAYQPSTIEPINHQTINLMSLIGGVGWVNPMLHGLKNVAGYTGGGHYGHPLENYPGGHFCGQIDL